MHTLYNVHVKIVLLQYPTENEFKFILVLLYFVVGIITIITITIIITIIAIHFITVQLRKFLLMVIFNLIAHESIINSCKINCISVIM